MFGVMAAAQLTRKLPDGQETTKNYPNSTPFENLKVGEVIELKLADGSIEKHVVMTAAWDFTHFGNCFAVVVEPVKKN
jgi:hypothetical protein